MLDPPLLLATTNPHKVRELCQMADCLPIRMRTAAQLGVALPEVEENGRTAAENARLKATQTAAHLGQWTLADDTVLEVDALDGRPGVLTARYAGPTADMRRNREKLIAELAMAESDGRGARFVCHLCVADAAGVVRFEAAGSCRGQILTAARGGGFGYDSLFYMPELGKTMAELDDLERRHVTHRAKALEQLAAQMWGGVDRRR